MKKIISRAKRALGQRGRKKRLLRIASEEKFNSGSKSYRKYGKNFVMRFRPRVLGKKGEYLIDISESRWEAPMSLALFTRPKNSPVNFNYPSKVFELKLGFEPGTVHVKTVQGVKGAIKDVKRFAAAIGDPPANYLLGMIEEHAKRTGFKRVEIAHPETLYYFANPDVGAREVMDVRKRMLKMYGSVAQAMGYKKQRDSYVKEL